MCMEDVHIGRLLRSNFLCSDVTGIPVILANPQRYGFTFNIGWMGVDAAPTVVIIADGSHSNRVIFTGASSPGIITIKEFGPQIPLRYNTNSVTGTAAFTITELILPEDVLSTDIESFKSRYMPWLLK